jgi:hypothetical protein
MFAINTFAINTFAINTFANQLLYKYNNPFKNYKHIVSTVQKPLYSKMEMTKYIAISNDKYIALYNKYNKYTINPWLNKEDFKKKQQKQSFILKDTLKIFLNISLYLILASFTMKQCY